MNPTVVYNESTKDYSVVVDTVNGPDDQPLNMSIGPFDTEEDANAYAKKVCEVIHVSNLAELGDSNNKGCGDESCGPCNTSVNEQLISMFNDVHEATARSKQISKDTGLELSPLALLVDGILDRNAEKIADLTRTLAKFVKLALLTTSVGHEVAQAANTQQKALRSILTVGAKVVEPISVESAQAITDALAQFPNTNWEDLYRSKLARILGEDTDGDKPSAGEKAEVKDDAGPSSDS